jgi:indole-3-glycerol phosphate synthase
MLDAILSTADVIAEVATSRMPGFRQEAEARPEARSLRAALSAPGLSVIAEIKRRSPSAGVIDPDLDPVEQAVAYEAGGADAISVLTEPRFFGGSLDDLIAVREAVMLPVLRKDFTRNEAQIWETRACGADAVLLIVAILDQPVLEALIAVAKDVGLEAIVEIHTTLELEHAIAAGADIIGVNNRDLSTLRTDLGVAEKLAAGLPDGTTTIAESGVSSIEGARRMRSAGYDAILVGEALVRADDPAALVAALKGTA